MQALRSKQQQRASRVSLCKLSALYFCGVLSGAYLLSTIQGVINVTSTIESESHVIPIPDETTSRNADAAATLNQLQEGSSSSRQPFNTTSTISKVQTTPPTVIHLLGERNSGTNYIESILKDAFYPRYSHNLSVPQPFANYLPLFVNKHMFRHSLLSEQELQSLQTTFRHVLWILVVRHPCAWADGMYRFPYHMCPPPNTTSGFGRCPGPYIGLSHALENISRPAFFQLPWSDAAEAKFPKFRSNFTYDSIFRLRRHKLQLMQQLIEAVGPGRAHVVSLNQVEASPERFVQNLVKVFGLAIKQDDYTPHNQSDKMHSAFCLENDMEWQIVQGEIDWEMEAHFGFTPLDCRTCIS